MKKNNYISVGKIMNFHGIKGEAKVGYTKGQEEFLSKLKEVLIKVDETYIPFTVSNIRFSTKNAVFKFKGIDSINDLLQYKGCIIYSEKIEAEKILNNGEFLADNLIGMDIFVDNKRMGSVTGVSTNGVQDLLSVKTVSQKIVLIPFVDAIVLKVDKKKRAITVADIKGLLE